MIKEKLFFLNCGLKFIIDIKKKNYLGYNILKCDTYLIFTEENCNSNISQGRNENMVYFIIFSS